MTANDQNAEVVFDILYLIGDLDDRVINNKALDRSLS